jgi:hypothetical protein
MRLNPSWRGKAFDPGATYPSAYPASRRSMHSHCDPRASGITETFHSHADRRIEPAGRDGRNPSPALRMPGGGVPVWLPPAAGFRRGGSCSAPRSGRMRGRDAPPPVPGRRPEIHVMTATSPCEGMCRHPSGMGAVPDGLRARAHRLSVGDRRCGASGRSEPWVGTADARTRVNILAGRYRPVSVPLSRR